MGPNLVCLLSLSEGDPDGHTAGSAGENRRKAAITAQEGASEGADPADASKEAARLQD